MRSMLTLMMVGVAWMPAMASAQVVTPAPMVVPDGTVLDVTATGRTVRTPDVATIRAGVVSQGATAAAALADNAQRMAGVVKALKAAGIAERDIATSNVGLSPQYRYAENQPPVITGYQANNTVSVTFRDVKKAGPVLDTLVRAGANQIEGPTMSLAEPDAALDEARTDAVARARARATLYARAAGLSVARIVSIEESGENAGDRPQPPVMMRVSAMAQRDAATVVMAGETDVTATVRVQFLLK